jgi:soluble lytic murein transglycosylase-like protein
MESRLSTALTGSSQQASGPSSIWRTIAHDTFNGLKTTMHHALMASGIIAIGALAFLFVKPDMVDHVKSLSPFSTDPAADPAARTPQLASLMPETGNVGARAGNKTSVPDSIPASAILPLEHLDATHVGTAVEQERVTKWLSRRYRVAKDATNMLVSAAYLTAQEFKLDPLLILSVMAIESRFNPFAESPVGAQGLMQVMSKVHHEKFQKLGGVQAALNPVANIKVGAQILKEYVRRGGSVEAGLKMYVGAAAMETDFGYGAKVLAEYGRLKAVAAGKKVPIFTAVATRAAAKQVENRAATEEKTNTITLAEPAAGDTPV